MATREVRRTQQLAPTWPHGRRSMKNETIKRSNQYSKCKCSPFFFPLALSAMSLAHSVPGVRSTALLSAVAILARQYMYYCYGRICSIKLTPMLAGRATFRAVTAFRC